MDDRQRTDQGRQEHGAAGPGQGRVGEPGAALSRDRDPCGGDGRPVRLGRGSNAKTGPGDKPVDVTP